MEKKLSAGPTAALFECLGLGYSKAACASAASFGPSGPSPCCSRRDRGTRRRDRTGGARPPCQSRPCTKSSGNHARDSTFLCKRRSAELKVLRPRSGAKKSAARQISHGARGVLLCCPREHGKENVSSCHSHVRADGAFEPGDWLDPIFREIDLALIARQVAMAMDAMQAGKSELCQDHLALLAVSARWSWHISSRGGRSHPPGCSQIAQ